MSKISGYAAFATLSPGDLLVGVDIDDTSMAATGTTKQLTFAQLQTFVKAGPVSAQAYPGNPAATASTTLVMMGLGGSCKITPGSSGKILLGISGVAFTNTAAVNFTFGGRYGTGTAPVNGAAVSGTRWGGAADLTAKGGTAGVGIPFGLTDLVTLTPATAYWFDIALLTSAGADTAVVNTLSFTAAEIS